MRDVSEEFLRVRDAWRQTPESYAASAIVRMTDNLGKQLDACRQEVNEEVQSCRQSLEQHCGRWIG